MMMARSGNYSYQHVRDPSGLDGDWSQVTAGMVKLKVPIHICDQAAMSFPAISSEARRFRRRRRKRKLVVQQNQSRVEHTIFISVEYNLTAE